MNLPDPNTGDGGAGPRRHELAVTTGEAARVRPENAIGRVSGSIQPPAGQRRRAGVSGPPGRRLAEMAP